MKNAWAPLKRILMNTSRKNYVLDELSCRTSMKNSVKQKNDQTEGKRSWNHKVKPCNDLDGSPWWWELGTSGKEKMTQLKTENLMSLRNKELNLLDETRIRITLCLSFTNSNWWQAMELAYYLFSWKGFKIDIAQTWEGLQRTTGMIGMTNELIRQQWKRILEEPP
mgnify:CR=1 FL=1